MSDSSLPGPNGAQRTDTQIAAGHPPQPAGRPPSGLPDERLRREPKSPPPVMCDAHWPSASPRAPSPSKGEGRGGGDAQECS